MKPALAGALLVTAIAVAAEQPLAERCLRLSEDCRALLAGAGEAVKGFNGAATR